jgi:hypothetical protein
MQLAITSPTFSGNFKEYQTVTKNIQSNKKKNLPKRFMEKSMKQLGESKYEKSFRASD